MKKNNDSAMQYFWVTGKKTWTHKTRISMETSRIWFKLSKIQHSWREKLMMLPKKSRRVNTKGTIDNGNRIIKPVGKARYPGLLKMIKCHIWTRTTCSRGLKAFILCTKREMQRNLTSTTILSISQMSICSTEECLETSRRTPPSPPPITNTYTSRKN